MALREVRVADPIGVRGSIVGAGLRVGEEVMGSPQVVGLNGVEHQVNGG